MAEALVAADSTAATSAASTGVASAVDLIVAVLTAAFDGGSFDRGGFDRGGFQGGGVRNDGVRGDGFDRNGAPLTRNQLNNFLGMPTDAGLHSMAGAPQGRAFAGAGAAAGRAAAGRGFDRAGVTHPYSSAYLHTQGQAARQWYNGRGYFNRNWINSHPWAWYPGAGR